MQLGQADRLVQPRHEFIVARLEHGARRGLEEIGFCRDQSLIERRHIGAGRVGRDQRGGIVRLGAGRGGSEAHEGCQAGKAASQAGEEGEGVGHAMSPFRAAPVPSAVHRGRAV